MVLDIHHVQITIPKGSETQARAFYCKLLGLREIDKPDSLKARGGFWLQVGTRQVHISLEDGIDREKTKAHIAYEVSDLNYWRTKLTEYGLSAQDNVPIPGYDRIELRDPFGNRVEMIQAL